MTKSLIALAILALLGAAVIAAPGFSPHASADEAYALAKADRLPVRLLTKSCTSQIWPRLDASCLYDVRSGMPVREARIIASAESDASRQRLRGASHAAKSFGDAYGPSEMMRAFPMTHSSTAA